MKLSSSFDACLFTIGTCAFPLFEQVLAQFIASECPLLILNTSNFSILHGLHVELDELHTDSCDMAHSHKSTHPSNDIGYPALQRWWQPARFLLASVLGAWC